MTERWRQSLGSYQVSSLGRVRNRHGRILKPRTKENGYLRVTICEDGRQREQYISRLVCTAFRGPPPHPDDEAHHKNRVRADNRLSNLRWMTPPKNKELRPIGEDHPKAKLTEVQVIEIRKRPTEKARSLGQEFGVHHSTILDIRHRRIWKHLHHVD